jgi:MFS family permease
MLTSLSATIINSDLVPGKHRGMYQALQNVLHGAGAVAGATLGGFLSDRMGWRMCFLAQTHVSMMSFVLAYFFVKDTNHGNSSDPKQRSISQQLDLAGASLLFIGLVLQLTAMSLGSEMSWSYPAVVITLIASIITLVMFVLQERRCKTTPILPLKLLLGRERIALLISNIALSITSYGVSGTSRTLHASCV